MPRGSKILELLVWKANWNSWLWFVKDTILMHYGLCMNPAGYALVEWHAYWVHHLNQNHCCHLVYHQTCFFFNKLVRSLISKTIDFLHWNNVSRNFVIFLIVGELFGMVSVNKSMITYNMSGYSCSYSGCSLHYSKFYRNEVLNWKHLSILWTGLY